MHLPDGTANCALTYVADINAIDDKKVPYSWYLKLVIAGAKQHGLPADYVAGLSEQPNIEDPEPGRSDKLEAEKVLAEYHATRESK